MKTRDKVKQELVSGKTVKQVADELGVSERAVYKHTKKMIENQELMKKVIYKKLNKKSSKK